MFEPLQQDRFYYRSTAASPGLEVCLQDGRVERIALSAVGPGRYVGEKLWVADLEGLVPPGQWQFRVDLGKTQDHPSYTGFYTTALHTLWLQDRQIFSYQPKGFVSPSRVVKLGAVKGSLPVRPFYVYLPRGYDRHSHRRYPVIYMHDGQNCFETYVEDSYAGSWQAEQAADLLIRQGLMKECLIVGVGNAQEERVLEYLPPYASVHPRSRRPYVESIHGSQPIDAPRRPLSPQPGRADQTIAYYGNEVAPLIERRFRTLSGREHRATCGSSMGGLFTLYMAWEHPEFARHHAALSTSFWITRNRAGQLEAIKRLQAGKPRDIRLWLDSGTRSSSDRGTDGMQDTRAARDALIESGMVEGSDFHYYLDEGANHSEQAWASRLPLVFQFLFPAVDEAPR